MSESTFVDRAKLYCELVANEHDRKYIMHLAQALDEAYTRISSILDDRIREAKHDLEILTGVKDAAAGTRSVAGEAGEKTAPVRGARRVRISERGRAD